MHGQRFDREQKSVMGEFLAQAKFASHEGIYWEKRLVRKVESLEIKCKRWT